MEGGEWHTGPGGGWLFPDPRGRVIDQRKDYGEWVTILDLAGVKHHRLHDARHTAASSLMDQGLDKDAIRAAFGWGSEAVREIYTQPRTEHLRAIAEAMEEVLPTGLQIKRRTGRDHRTR